MNTYTPAAWSWRPLEGKGHWTSMRDARCLTCAKSSHRYVSFIVLRLPVQLPPHGDIPHRHHLLLATLTTAVLVPTRHRRHVRVHPRLLTLVALVDLAAPSAAVVAAGQRARSMGVAGFFHVGETLGAELVGFAAAGEAGAEGGGQEFAEDGSEHGEAGGEDADVAFDV